MKKCSKMALVGICVALMCGTVFAIIFGVTAGVAAAVDALTGSRPAASACAMLALIVSVGACLGAGFCLIDRLEETLAARIGAWVRS